MASTGCLGAILVIFAALSVAYAAFAALVGGVALVLLARLLKWPGSWTLKTAWLAGLMAIVAHMVVTLAIDIVLRQSYSAPSMMPALDRLFCHPGCSVSDFYVATVGVGVGSWIKYALLQLPGLFACALSFRKRQSLGFLEPGGWWRAVVSTAVVIGVGLAIAMPTFVHLFLRLIVAAQ